MQNLDSSCTVDEKAPSWTAHTGSRKSVTLLDSGTASRLTLCDASSISAASVRLQAPAKGGTWKVRSLLMSGSLCPLAAHQPSGWLQAFCMCDCAPGNRRSGPQFALGQLPVWGRRPAPLRIHLFTQLPAASAVKTFSDQQRRPAVASACAGWPNLSHTVSPLRTCMCS